MSYPHLQTLPVTLIFFNNNKPVTKTFFNITSINRANAQKKISPVKTYDNAATQKKRIMADNRGLSGIYRWVNKTNGKTYVGSGKDLSKRLYIYYKSSELIRSKRPIHQALQKYGYEGFILEILEYCNLNELIKREQHYLDILEPEYNILKIAYSLAGFKHSDDSKALLKAKALLRGVAVWVLNTETGKKILFPTLIEAGKYLGVSPTSIRNTAVKGDFIKNIYLITKEGDDSSISTDQAPQDNRRKKVMVKVLNTLTKQETVFYSQSEAAKFYLFLYTFFGSLFLLLSLMGTELLSELFTSFELSYGYNIYLSFAPLITYFNPDLEKVSIILDNKNKSGVYRWVNLKSGKSYVGSSVRLSRRFTEYYSIAWLTDKTKINSHICRALLKYGYSGFKLEILEYCDTKDVLKREQHYLDLYNPEYNILKVAGSSFGYKHTEAVKGIIRLKMTGRRHTAESKALIGAANSGINHPMFGKSASEQTKIKLSIANGFAIKVTDLETNIEQTYSSTRKAAEFLCVDSSHLSKCLRASNSLIVKDRYKVEKS